MRARTRTADLGRPYFEAWSRDLRRGCATDARAARRSLLPRGGRGRGIATGPRRGGPRTCSCRSTAPPTPPTACRTGCTPTSSTGRERGTRRPVCAPRGRWRGGGSGVPGAGLRERRRGEPPVGRHRSERARHRARRPRHRLDDEPRVRSGRRLVVHVAGLAHGRARLPDGSATRRLYRVRRARSVPAGAAAKRAPPPGTSPDRNVPVRPAPYSKSNPPHRPPGRRAAGSRRRRSPGAPRA